MAEKPDPKDIAILKEKLSAILFNEVAHDGSFDSGSICDLIEQTIPAIDKELLKVRLGVFEDDIQKFIRTIDVFKKANDPEKFSDALRRKIESELPFILGSDFEDY